MKFNPLDYPVTFLEPVILNLNSAWLEHIPFALALIEMHKPDRLVELGVHAGDSYCTFCQAVKHLALPTECFGVDSWGGDKHAGNYGEGVLPRLRAYHDPRYAGFSRLLPMDFDAAAGRFENASIDLLHIDGLHTYEAVKHDFETWLSKMSDRGIVLFHDTMVRRDDFGVYRLWAELAGRYPHFCFEHGSGLGILAVGKNVPASLQPLLSASDGEAQVIRNFYLRIGKEIDTQRFFTRIMQNVFHGQAIINQWKQQTGQIVSAESRDLQSAMGRPLAYLHGAFTDVAALAAENLQLREQAARSSSVK